MDDVEPADVYERINDEVRQVLVGQEALIERFTIALFTQGHILLEGVPGLAKTMAANLFAEATGLSYNRIQMTPDILPADITGTQIYREAVGEFELQRGPVFANIVVADEINRATPKAQSALLEAMQEETVTIEGDTLNLPDPFIVIATQNPLEMEGVFALPEAQRDRFLFRLVLEYPDAAREDQILERFDGQPELGPEDIEQVVSSDEILAARDRVTEVYVADAVREYIREVVRATREHPDTDIGGSPRAMLMLMRAAKARASLEGRRYVIPDDVIELAVPVLNHRLVLNTDAQLGDVTPTDVIDAVLEDIDPPSAEFLEDVSPEVRDDIPDAAEVEED